MDEGSQLSAGNLIVILLLLAGAAFFAVMETSFASVNRMRMKARAEQGVRRAKKAMYVLDNFDKAISTILIGTNIIHLSTASYVTVLVTRRWGVSWVTLGSLVTTMVVFFIGEMLPKSVAKKYSERLALATADPLCFFMLIFTPFSYILTKIGDAVLKLTHRGPEVTVTEDELHDIIESMADEGEITAERGELMSSALDFADVPVESVLTARVDVAAVDVDDSPEEILAYIRAQRHSRLPVYEGSIDNVIGVLQIRKYMKACLAGHGPVADIRPLLDEAMFVHHSKAVDDLLTEMSRRKMNLAVVTDNYGGMLGIVTVEDIVEELVGEIWDEEDLVEETFVPLGGGRFEADAELTVGELFDRLDFEDPEDDENLRYKLLGEWVYEQFDDIPRERDSFKYHNLDVRISDMKQKRIVKLEVRVRPETDADAAEGGVAE